MAELDEADPGQHLTFRLAGETFAVPVRQVREVLDLQRIARLANAPPLLLGVVDVRGQGIPVVDLKRKLALPGGGTDEHSRLLVLEVNRSGRPLVVAALADAVHEVTHLAGDTIEPPPEFGQDWDSGFLRGLSRRDGAFVTVLDLERLFAAGDLDSPGLAA